MTAAQRPLRLLPAVVVGWALALLLARLPVAIAIAVAATCVTVAVVSAWWWRAGHPGGTWSVVAGVGLAGALVSGSVAVHVAVAQAEPWPALTTGRVLVEARLEVIDPGRPVARPAAWDAGDGQQRTVARVVALTTPQQQGWSAGSRVRLIAPWPQGQPLLAPGQVVTGSFRVGPDDGATGLSATLAAVGPLVTEVQPDGPGIAVRDRLRLALAGLPTAQAELVMGMVLGDDELLPAAEREAMRTAGLSHLTAVSGANIAIVTGLVLWCARLAGVPVRFALPPAAAVLAGYVVLVGPEPSVVRATAMALVTLLALVLGGGNGMAALLVAALGLLVLDPWLAASRGFALSCAATAGLIVASTPGRKLVDRWSQAAPATLRPAVAMLAATALTALAAALATAPLLAAYGQGISWVSVLANVAVAPMVPVVTISGLLVGGLSWGVPSLASVVAVVPGLGAGWIIDVANWAAAVPGGRLPWPSGWTWGAILAVMVGVLLLLGRRWRWLPVLVPAGAAAASLTAASAPAALNSLPEDWQVVFCDVGQGDAALLRTGPQAAVLVDAGPDPAAAQECLDRSGITTVPAVVLSHFHRDHVAGLATVLARHRPQLVLVSPLAEPPDTYADTARVLHESGTAATTPRVGQRFAVGWLSWTVTGPARLPGDGSAPNNASVTMTATVARDDRRTTVFFGGDLEPEGQQVLLSGGQPIDVDVAKVPHHGSAQQHPRLPTWTGAEVAVVSCGRDNDYGHPSPLTVAAWQGAGADVVRTDTVGDVIIVGRPGQPPQVFGRAVAS